MPAPELAGGGVHHVLGMSLDHRHRGLQPVQGAELGRIGKQPGELAAQQPAHDVARIADQPASQRADRGGVEPGRGALQQLADQLAHVGRQPRNAIELDHVSGLVQRHPPQEEASVRPELPPCGRQVLGDEQEPGGALGPDQRHVVLPEHPSRRIAHRDAGLGAGRGADDRAGDGRQRPGRSSSAKARSSMGVAASQRGSPGVARAHARRSISSGSGGASTAPSPA